MNVRAYLIVGNLPRQRNAESNRNGYHHEERDK